MNNHQRDIIIAAGCGDFLRRDWAVRVLDAWADDVGGEWKVQSTATVWRCSCDVGSDRKGWDCHALMTGPTPEAARLAAAEAVWPELPESVRAEIGERP